MLNFGIDRHFPVHPEPVEGHAGRFDTLTANGLFFRQHALLRNNFID